MHQRYYSNQLGRFVSVDPVQGQVGSSQSWNRYSYVRNNPLNFVDPTGEYGRGAGFSDEEWERFDRAQQNAATKMEKRAAKLESKAAKREKKGKSGAEKLRIEANNLRAGANVLRSDGSDGYVAFGVHTTDIMDLQGGEGQEGLERASYTAAGTNVCSFDVWVNLDHSNWTDPYKAERTVGHESLHNIGLYDEPLGDPPLAYKRGFPGQIKRFNQLKGTLYESITPELLMDRVYP